MDQSLAELLELLISLEALAGILAAARNLQELFGPSKCNLLQLATPTETNC